MSRLRRRLRYASYVVRHKWFLLSAGLRVGAPLWRLLTHDWSKLSLAEWTLSSFHNPNTQRRSKPQMEASTSKTQTAHLIVNDSAQTLVATVRVPAFPDNPDVVKFGDEVFGNGSVGYGVDFLTYLRQSVYDATGQA